MAKVLCVLYDDPVSGYPPRYARDDVPKIERYHGGQSAPTPKAIDFTPGELLGSAQRTRARCGRRGPLGGAAVGERNCGWLSVSLSFSSGSLARQTAWKAVPGHRRHAPVGGAQLAYTLDPYEIKVVDGRCATSDGVLAGSALDVASAVRNCIQKVGIPKDEAFRMASMYPPQYVGQEDVLGRVAPGYQANLVLCDNEVYVRGVVRSGILQGSGQ